MTSKLSSALRSLTVSGAVATAAFSLAPVSVFAAGESPVLKINDAAAKADIEVTPLRGNMNVLLGSGGNITVLSGPQGKLLVDAGIGVSKEKIAAALDKLGPGPLKYLINTHYHWDHTDGNVWVQQAGATIIGHPNTLKRLSESVRVDDWDFTFKPLPAAARPTQLLKSSKTMNFAGNKITMRTFGPGHTDSDLWVYFDKADVLVLGDIFWNGVYPFIDNENGGGIKQAIVWASKAIDNSTDKTIIVPGHGPVGTHADLIAFRDMLVSVRDNVAALKKQNKSLEETIAAKPTAAFDAKWGNYVIDPAFFTRLVYNGL
jgi:glyoxylase-like metal-dependent hydrolase (beta-lactamase superfamily II)